MIYKKYGKTGIDISAVGMGGMRFENRENIDKCAELMIKAWESGINYFDTAPGYDKSEQIFGAALKEMLPERKEKPFFIATKTNKKDRDGVKQDIEESLKRMGLEYIDFYHVWYVLSLEDFYARVKNGVLDEFENLKRQGLIKHICISTHMNGEDIEQLFKEYCFDGILLGYSAMNFAYREKGIEAAYKHGAGVVTMNPLGGGFIPENPDLFEFLKEQEDDNVVEGALRFLINNKKITAALVGMGKIEHLSDALNAVNKFKPISLEKEMEIRSNLKEYFNKLCTNCRYCDSCPQGIPVPQLMETFNYRMRQKDVEFIKGRLKWHWGIEVEHNYYNDCIKCGKCEKACTQHLDIINRMKELYDLLES